MALTLPQRRAELALVGGAIVVAGTLVVLAGVSWWLRGERVLPVAQPLVVLMGAGVLFLGILLRRERAAPFLSLGGFAGAMILLYSVYPLLIFVMNGGVYTPRSDVRLFEWPPAPEDIAIFGWWYLVFLLSFAVAYLLVAPSTRRSGPLAVQAPPRGMLIVVLTAFVALQIYLTTTRILFDLGGDDYFEGYVQVQNLPLLVRQFYVHLAEMRVTLLILLLSVLFAQYRRYRRWIALLAAVEVVSSLQVLQSRTEIFVFLVALMVLYHNLVRRIPMWIAATAGVLLVGAFVFLGMVRSSGLQGATALDLVRGDSEFEAIMSNAYDLRSVKRATGALTAQPAVYFSDFTNVLPQQLLPFQKRDKAEWFLTTYYPKAAASGNGFAFGALAEAVTGFGWIELLVRGAVVGLAFGLFQRRLVRGPVTVWRMTLSVWMLVFSYQLLRNTTFCYLTRAEYGVFVPLVAVRAGHYFLAVGRRRLHALQFTPSPPPTARTARRDGP